MVTFKHRFRQGASAAAEMLQEGCRGIVGQLLAHSAQDLANELRVVTNPPLHRPLDERTQGGKEPQQLVDKQPCIDDDAFSHSSGTRFPRRPPLPGGWKWRLQPSATTAGNRPRA